MDESKYYLQIDILKALAIISVIILHILPSNIVKNPIFIFTIGQAVPIFFVLMATNAFMSFKRRRYGSLLHSTYLKTRFKRVIYPLIIIWILAIILVILLNKEMYIGIFTLIGYLPLTGPGNYFISIIIQFVIIFPILYRLYNYNPKFLLIMSLILNFAFEITASKISIFNGSYLYSACILRYIFLITLGMWLVDKYEHGNLKSFVSEKIIILGLILSITYIMGVSVFSWNFMYFQKAWQPQTVLSFFYPLILCAIGIKYLPSIPNIFWNILGVIGKASYHIFLVQILFFGAGFSIISIIMHYSLQKIYNIYALGFLALIGNIIIIVALGLMFFFIESKLIKSKPV